MIRRLVPVIALVASSIFAAVPAQAVIAPDTHCRSGKVSITFDDGPHKTNTPKLLKVLRTNHAQATFFVEGKNVKRYPKLLRAMVHDGHAVENHSWDHPQLTHLSNKQIAGEISRTTKIITRTTGIRPHFMRPPYGDTNARVKKVIKKQHLKQELWTIDTNDWRGGSPKAIRKAALRGLHKHTTNVILMHDAVANSPRTIKAVPGIIKGLRTKGYCLVPLQVTAKDSQLRRSPIRVGEGSGSSRVITVRFSLSAPSQRAGSFRVHTSNGTAVAHTDYVPTDRRISFARGATVVTMHLRIHADPMPNADKTFTLFIGSQRHVRLVTTRVPITIVDNGGWQATSRELLGQSWIPTARLVV